MSDRKFRVELTDLLNRFSKENRSGTPDYLLADFLIRCLEAFDYTTNSREEWHGRPIAHSPETNT